MKWFWSLLHFYFPKKCAAALAWEGNGLYCARCGELLGFYNRFAGEVRPYVSLRYRSCRRKLEAELRRGADAGTEDPADRAWTEFLNGIKEQARARDPRAVEEDGPVREQAAAAGETGGSARKEEN